MSRGSGAASTRRRWCRRCRPTLHAALVRTVPDFPKPGILFYDITTLLKDKTGFAQLIDALAAHYLAEKVDLVLGIEARGFIFGPALAYRLNAGFVPVRKPRKLPAPVGRGGPADRRPRTGCDRPASPTAPWRRGRCRPSARQG